MSMWHHFTDAADSMLRVHKMEQVKEAAIFAHLIGKWPKFYIPEAGDIAGRRYFDDLKPMLRLPYPGIVTLRETRLNGGQWEGKRGKVLTAFFDMGEATVDGRHIIDPALFPRPSWGAFCVCWTPDLGWWPMPPTSFVLDGSAAGISLRLPNDPLIDEYKRAGAFDQMIEDTKDEALAFVETCMLLNCNNVETIAVPAPRFVNKKRIAKGKRPLYEYHVLKVDGEVWDSPSGTTRDGFGVRSHFRRGHFRRLDETRMTWVRATMVKGSVPGFVDKDYDIKPRALA